MTPIAPAPSSNADRAEHPGQLLVELKYLYTLHENILFKMLRSKWLLSFNLSGGKQWQLKWTAEGKQRVLQLREIIASYRLTEDDLFPVGFTIMARDGKMSEQMPDVPRKVLDFWRACCNEIGLANSMEDCAMFVQIVSANRDGQLD